jgi:putative transcriptional regulator
MRNDVRERRALLAISQADLGTAMGVSRQTINSIEKGRYLPSLPLALALARYFKTTVEEMFDAETAHV